MYSGITKGLFKVISLNKNNNLLNYTVLFSKELIANLKVGDSVAVDGVCQTVVCISGEEVSFQAIDESLQKTTLDDLVEGSLVSIERSLRFGDEIGGHEVSGHVFGTGLVSQVLNTRDNLTLVIHCNPDWMKYVFHKGFITVDGSSLTVGEIDVAKGLFAIHIIPETQRVTNFKNKKINDKVNLEFDYKTKTIVEVVERFLKKTSI